MSSTRELVLKNLLNRQRCTINDLAEAVQINPISVRHHIAKLEADGLVNSEEERHGVGRPRRVYYLTDAGMEKFPSRYLALTTRLLEQLKGSISEETLNKIFTQLASDMAQDHVAKMNIQDLGTEARLELLQKILREEGFVIEVERVDEKFVIKETSCPYYHVGQEHPEVCIVDKTLISTVLNTPVEKITCMLDGDSICAYEVPVIAFADVE
ncbi:MAG: ArsR family transcriptional regulator [Anaerolineales bacterium]|nr:ArsR family transcriptional regulator [Anaerolineales bacterium]